MGGSSHPVTTTTESKQKTSIPGWMSQAGAHTYNAFSKKSKGASGPLTPTDIANGSTYVAPLDPLQEQGLNDISAHAFDYQPGLTDAQGLLDPSNFNREINFGSGMSRSTGDNGQQVINFEDFTPASIDRFMNPYRNTVIDQGLADIDRENQMAANRASDAAVAAGAFGGARHGVAESETNRNAQIQRNNFVGTQLDNAYQAAVAQRNAERDAALRGLGLETDTRLKGASAISDLAGKAQDWGLKAGGAEMGAGAVRQEQEQKVRDAAAKLKQQPLEYLLAQAGLLGQLPHDTSQTSSGTSTTPEADPNIFGEVLGAGTSLAGAALGGPAGSAGSQLMSFLLSDEDQKDIEGELDPSTGFALDAFSRIPVSTYHYKPDAVDIFGVPKTKRVGPMAQDWAEEFGGDGRTIDVGNMLGALTLAVKELDARTREPVHAFG